MRRSIVLLVLAGLAWAVPQAASAAVAPKASVLVDADSGKVLAESNSHLVLPPASTAKLMTALVAVEQLPADAVFRVGEHPAQQVPLRIGMKTGEAWPLRDALSALLMVSANDAAYALAEASSGSLEAFAHEMQAAAARYGMRDSSFGDPSGFDAATPGGGSRTSAYDLAVAARNALAVPAIADLAALPEYRFTGPDGQPHRLRNINRMLTRYPGAVGLKTGYTRLAGHTLVAAARRGGRTMIAVVLGADDADGAASALLDRGFATPPDAPGTGEQLPAARVKPLSGRMHGKVIPGPETKPGRSAVNGAATSNRSHRSAHKDFLAVWLVAIAAVVGSALFLARRRALRRQRRRRHVGPAAGSHLPHASPPERHRPDEGWPPHEVVVPADSPEELVGR